MGFRRDWRGHGALRFPIVWHDWFRPDGSNVLNVPSDPSQREAQLLTANWSMPVPGRSVGGAPGIPPAAAIAMMAQWDMPVPGRSVTSPPLNLSAIVESGTWSMPTPGRSVAGGATKTSLGTVTDSLQSATLSLSVTLAANDLLIVSVSTNSAGAAANITTITWNGLTLTRDKFSATANFLDVWSIKCTSGATANIVASWPIPRPVTKAMTAIKVQNLANYALDQPAASSGTSTGPQSGSTGVTNSAAEYVHVVVGTNGPLADAAGSWDAGYSDGQRDGTALGSGDTTISDGYQIATVAAMFHAGKSGITSRQWSAICATYS